MSLRIAIAGLALIAAFAAPASAQETFTDIRDAVPLRFFNAEATAADPSAPDTLIIAFESGDQRFRASAFVDGTGTRIAMDTLSFVVNAPAGHYVASITCKLSGRGVVSTALADASVAANWVINGQPATVASVGGQNFSNTLTPWSAEQTAAFTVPTLTSVPVSLTAELFAFAAPNNAEADVALTSATIMVTFAPATPQN